jgi:hypothetical protein
MRRGPEPPRRAELGDLLEEVVVRVEEERDPGREAVDGEPAIHGRADVLEPVRERERDLLHRGRSCLANVVAAHRDRVPLRHFGRTELEEIGRDLEGRGGRIDVRAARDVLLEHVVLHRPRELGARRAALVRDGDDECEEDHRGRVDGHGERDLVERDVVKEALHVIQGRDRNAHASHLALRAFGVGVVAHLCGEIERYGEPRLTERQEIVVALIRRYRVSEACVLAHGPEAGAVHRRVDAAKVGGLAGDATFRGVRHQPWSFLWIIKPNRIAPNPKNTIPATGTSSGPPAQTSAKDSLLFVVGASFSIRRMLQ